jgi:hypothetical protein
VPVKIEKLNPILQRRIVKDVKLPLLPFGLLARRVAKKEALKRRRGCRAHAAEQATRSG